MKEVKLEPSYATYLSILKFSETNKEDAIKLLQLFLDTVGEHIPLEKTIKLFTAKDLIEEYLADVEERRE